jgi:hypothetical protein
MNKLIFLILAVSPTLLTGCSFVGFFVPPINAWVAEWDGKSELARAGYSKQVQIQEAKGKEEAAKYLADAEIARAHGIAEANKIIGNSLKDNEGYLRWLYIDALKSNEMKEVIYIPTEAGLPILERRK